MSHELIVEANLLVSNKPSLEKMLTSLKDTSIPLDVRWDTYEILVKGQLITEIELYGNGLTDILRKPNVEVGPYRPHFTPNGSFYLDRYQTATYLEIAEQIEFWDEDLEQDRMPTHESVVEWKEAVLKRGTAGFKYDW